MYYMGSKIYYVTLTGKVIWRTDQISSEKEDWMKETTFEEDYATYTELQKYVVDAIGVIQLEFNEYAQDFAECNGYRINPDTLMLEFSYPEPSVPELPVYQAPLSEKVDALEAETTALNLAIIDVWETITSA